MAKKKAAKARPRKGATPRRAPKTKRGGAPSVAELQAQVRTLARQLTEAHEQQTATSEVLKVISSSPGELQPVFTTILDNATRLCEAGFGVLYRQNDGVFDPVAMHNVPEKFEAFLRRRGPFRVPAGRPLARLLKTRRLVHVIDEASGPDPAGPASMGGARSLIAVPMLKKSVLVGAFIIYRKEVRPFAEKQIELVKNFAAQAVIAIENTRLLNELRQRTGDLTESLEQQTATSEVLKVISSSPGELEPVFQAMLENATRICEAKFGTMYRYDGDAFHVTAMHNAPPAFEAARRRAPIRPPQGSALAQTAATKQIAHIHDIREQLSPLANHEYVRAGVAAGYRTLLCVPMLKNNELIGTISIFRPVVRPFTDKQIDLVQNFAAQAVIAIENTRLLSELRQRTDDLSESLEQQTATSEVLKVISSSPGDLDPVFQAMLENAVRICDAKFGAMYRYESGGFRPVALHNGPPEYVKQRGRDQLLRPPPDVPLGAIVATKQACQAADVKATKSYREGHPFIVAGADLGGYRTALAVPMLKDDELIGAITITRQEVQPFADKQIELVTNFAAQAVIAIENTRLLNELRQRTDDLSESLEQQTATSEVLRVISSSPGELGPVFQAMLDNAIRICGAKFGVLYLYEGEKFRPAALASPAPEFEASLRERGAFTPDPDQPLSRLLRTKDVVHTSEDGTSDRPIPAFRFGGARTHIAVPMLKDHEVVGAINIYRQELRPFTDKQIELVTNFAAQAVIAIENARLLSELRQRTDDLSESLEQQTATSEVLKVISSSPGELEPVFQAMLANAVRICDAKFGALHRFDGNKFYPAAMLNFPSALAEFQRKRGMFLPDAGNALDRMLQTKMVVHVADDVAERIPSPAGRLGGARSLIAVPMLKENELVGAIFIYRQEVRPFTDKQIELVQNFAAQAVIAIENTRLLNELRQRTDDLTESLEQQTATSEVLKVISSSPGDLAPVFQAMLENATRICNVKFANLLICDGETFRVTAMHGAPLEWETFRSRTPRVELNEGHPLDDLIRSKRLQHIADARLHPSYLQGHRSFVPLVEVAGARTLLVVPMLKENELIGAFGIYNQEVRPFTGKQIELVQNFAAQAVIAIENTRLLGELREALQQQTATADVLKVISRSTFDLQTVLDTLVESAARLTRSERAAIRIARDGLYHNLANYGFMPEHRERMRREAFKPDRMSIVGRVVLEGKTIHLADAQADSDPVLAQRSHLGGVRSTLGVPLLREGTPIGVLLLQRGDVQPYTDKQIELANTFADQAVIAIENVRLFDEVQARTEDLAESLQQQTATADVLKVISRSTFDLQTVLDTLVASAARLCEADMASINRQTGNNYRQVASFGYSPEFIEFMERHPIPSGRGSAVGRAVEEGKIVQIDDVMADSEFAFSEAAMIGGIRTILGVPLLREGSPIGVITLQRKTVRPFTQKQIELVESFADQAVIAIENVRLFDEIQDKSRQLAEASQHKSQFLANMSHELRTPLNAIIGYTELIIDGIYGETPDKALTVLKRVESNGRHLLGLINDVLDFSKIEAGQLKLAISEYSMKDIVHNVYSAVEPLAAKKNLKFKVEVPPDLPAGHGDQQKLTQVLLNLVGNAIKFTDAGEVAIKVAPGNGAFSVAVHDTGPGIDPANQDKLFEEFQQADNSITKAKGGTGLGLAIARRIIEMHGGRLWVDSSPGNGSVFTFEIPSVVEQARPL